MSDELTKKKKKKKKKKKNGIPSQCLLEIFIKDLVQFHLLLDTNFKFQ